MNESIDFTIIECALEDLKSFVEILEKRYDIQMVKKPSLSLTMIRAEDSVEFQEFYLGEALSTDCEVAISNITGYGICLGDEPQRAYCMAVIDSLLQFDPENMDVKNFLNDQSCKIEMERNVENSHISRTRVDFKMMEQA
jgi:alpha-D-ribose 1-methylphosphonate 5-triphosphate synthase subunit PhnG